MNRVERAERRAATIVAFAMTALCVYVFGIGVYGLVARAKPDHSLPGIAVTAIAAVAMPWLGGAKRAVANRIASDALRGDAACSWTCAYMALSVLAGLALNALFGWWWAEDVAAFALLYWLAGETREAIEAARSG